MKRFSTFFSRSTNIATPAEFVSHAPLPERKEAYLEIARRANADQRAVVKRYALQRGK